MAPVVDDDKFVMEVPETDVDMSATVVLDVGGSIFALVIQVIFDGMCSIVVLEVNTGMPAKLVPAIVDGRLPVEDLIALDIL